MTENGNLLVYDGTFNGFLTAIFTAFEDRLTVVDIKAEQNAQNALFADSVVVATQIEKARRVWNGIENKQYRAAKKLYFAFLSEKKDIEYLLFQYIKNLFRFSGDAFAALDHKIESIAVKVEAEKKQLESTLRFQTALSEVQVAMLTPRYNILPLISKHFRSLMPHDAWILYDQKRNYGLYYHHQKMEILRLSPEEASLLCEGTKVSYMPAGSKGSGFGKIKGMGTHGRRSYQGITAA